jgi:hypothetical protein
MALPQTMESIRLLTPGVNGLRREAIGTPSLGHGEALVEVHAAAITRDQLEWPLAMPWLTELPAAVPVLPGARSAPGPSTWGGRRGSSPPRGRPRTAPGRLMQQGGAVTTEDSAVAREEARRHLRRRRILYAVLGVWLVLCVLWSLIDVSDDSSSWWFY